MQGLVTCSHSPDHQPFVMGHRMYCGVLLALAAPLVQLSSASAATWTSPQSHFSAARPQKSTIPQHFEANIISDPKTNTCLYAFFGTTQPHKELTRILGQGGSYHTERFTFDSGRDREAGKLERIRVFSTNTRVLRDYSVALCGHGGHLGTFPIYDTLSREGGVEAGVLTYQMTEGDVPPLEVRPIFQSGDPNNRVDLVFFGDGCKFFKQLLLFPVTYGSHALTICQTRNLKNQNFSMMQPA